MPDGTHPSEKAYAIWAKHCWMQELASKRCLESLRLRSFAIPTRALPKSLNNSMVGAHA